MSSFRGPGKNKPGGDRPFGRDRDEGRVRGRGRGPFRGQERDPRNDGHEQNRGEHRERGVFFAGHGASPTEQAMTALMMTAKMIHRFAESRIAEHKKFHKLSRPRMGVLFIVQHSGGIRMGDLAAKLGVAPRTVTDLVDGLEQDGFLHRIPDPSDRRASMLELSSLAQKEFEHIVSMRSKFIDEIFSPLSSDEKDTLISLLKKLREGPIRDLNCGFDDRSFE